MHFQISLIHFKKIPLIHFTIFVKALFRIDFEFKSKVEIIRLLSKVKLDIFKSEFEISKIELKISKISN